MTKIHKIPEFRIEGQQITPFSGLLIFQLLFTQINLKQQLKKCVDNVILFHSGRGSQEAVFADVKNDTALDVIHCRRLAADQTYCLCAMMAHDLSREVQMPVKPAAPRTLPKRPAAWAFERLDTLRHRMIQRAGRLTRPQGKLTLSMSVNQAVRDDLLHFLDALKKAA